MIDSKKELLVITRKLVFVGIFLLGSFVKIASLHATIYVMKVSSQNFSFSEHTIKNILDCVKKFKSKGEVTLKQQKLKALIEEIKISLSQLQGIERTEMEELLKNLEQLYENYSLIFGSKNFEI